MRGLTVALVVVSALALASTPSSAGARFAIEPFDLRHRPGESIRVAGTGCPSTGDVPSSSPLFLRLTPPGERNFWGPAIIQGSIWVIGTSIGIAGEADATASTDADGTFEAVITIPGDAPVTSGYTIRAVCTSLLVLGDDGPDQFTQASWDASQVEVGTLRVVTEGASPLSTTSTAGAPAATAAPRFTG